MVHVGKKQLIIILYKSNVQKTTMGLFFSKFLPELSAIDEVLILELNISILFFKKL
jgi:hypothetical protein